MNLQLGISPTTLKVACRKLSISKWPYRTFKRNKCKEEEGRGGRGGGEEAFQGGVPICEANLGFYNSSASASAQSSHHGADRESAGQIFWKREQESSSGCLSSGGVKVVAVGAVVSEYVVAVAVDNRHTNGCGRFFPSRCARLPRERGHQE